MTYYNHYFHDRSWVKRVIVNRSVDEDCHEVVTKKTFDIKIPDEYPSSEDGFNTVLLDFVPKQSLLKFDLTVNGNHSVFINKTDQIDFFYNLIREIWPSSEDCACGKFESELKEMLEDVCRYRPSLSEELEKVQEKIEKFFKIFELPGNKSISNSKQLISMLLKCTPIICKLEKGAGDCIIKYSYSKPLLPDISYKSCIRRFSPIENIETDLLFWDSCTNHYYLHYPKDVKVSTDIKVIQKYSASETIKDYRYESKDNIVFYKIYRNTSDELRSLNERHGIYFRLFPLSLGIRSWSLWITVLLGLLTFILCLIHTAKYTGYFDGIFEGNLVKLLESINFSKNNSLPFIIAIGTIIISWFVRVPKNRVSERTRAPHQVILFATLTVQLLIILILMFGLDPAGNLIFLILFLSSIIIIYRGIVGTFYCIYNKNINVKQEYEEAKKSYLSSEH